MENMYLEHSGVRGMRWGIRRSPKQLGKSVSTKVAKQKLKGKKKTDDDEIKTKKSIKSMTDDELKTKIERMKLEQSYKQLTADPNAIDFKKRGRDFALDVLEKSGKNIAVQLINSAAAKASNKALGYDKDGKQDYSIYTNNKKKDK